MSSPHETLHPLTNPTLGKLKHGYWKPLADFQWETDPDSSSWKTREFPEGASEWTSQSGRREFIKLMGASFALAGLSACTKQPIERIIPYVSQPPEVIPGIPLHFATVMPHLGGVGRGVVVESHEGRPTKIEGNPLHPSSLGAADVFTQASILNLYDPDRSQAVKNGDTNANWDLFFEAILPLLTLPQTKTNQGSGLRILTETITSPTAGALLTAFQKKYPKSKWIQFEPISRDATRQAAREAFEQPVETHYDFQTAKVILALDSDFLYSSLDAVRYARRFTNGRRLAKSAAEMNRLYVIEPTPTSTGASADHRFAFEASQIEPFLQAVVDIALSPNSQQDHPAFNALQNRWIRAIANDLLANRGKGIVLVGERQPASAHLLAHQLNDYLGNIGSTIWNTQSPEVNPIDQTSALAQLVQDLNNGIVEGVFILGANPVYNAPSDFDFRSALKKAKTTVHLGTHYDETALECQWHLPQSHYLEEWADIRAVDGTVSIAQPLILPLYSSTRSLLQVLHFLAEEPTQKSTYDIVHEFWQNQQAALPPQDFLTWWRKTIHDGVVENSAFPRQTLRVKTPLSTSTRRPTPTTPQTIDLAFALDPSVGDGRFCNNGWLQEIPKPITKLTWDNAALISKELAKELKVENQDILSIETQGHTVHAPVFIVPGQANRTVTLHLGYGRTSAGRVGNGKGMNAYLLRTSTASGFATDVRVKKVGGRWNLATTQRHHYLEGRDVAHCFKASELEKVDSLTEPAPAKTDTLYSPYNQPHLIPDTAWAMVIDLNTCIGCNACIVACQSENNIPIVGKGEVDNGREMHWIRVDTYYKTTTPEEGDIEFLHEPLPCMQCENAPCEVVCPVAATVHSQDGLNEQIYNRCVGTRYCSNNCPYKVRRFNFFQWADQHTLTYKMQRNPNVTVRSRGVMEKCTYCVQRIEEVRITVQLENRNIRDGEILTACQQTCPTDAIIFGDKNDPNSKVAHYRKQRGHYGMLAELNTRPRTTYLPRIKNENPAIAAA